MKVFYKNGKLTGFAAQVTFKEYPYVKGNSKKKKTVSSKKKKNKKSKSGNGIKDTGTDNKKTSGKSTSGKDSSSRIKKGYQAYVVKKGEMHKDASI